MVLTALAAPSQARAQGVVIDGNPLQIQLDAVGGLQVTYDGKTQLYPSDPEDAAGLWLRSGNTTSTPGTGDRTIGEPSEVTANGTHTVTAEYDVIGRPALPLHVTEVDTYTDGSRDLTRSYAIKNTGGTPVALQAGEIADTTFGGNDSGRGFLPPGSAHMVAGIGAPGQLSGLVEVTPWEHSQEGSYGDIYDKFRTATLKDAVDPNPVDNGVGAQWSKTLAPGETWTVDVKWRFDAGVRVNDTGDQGGGTCTAQSCTLRDAVASAPNGSVITLSSGDFVLGGLAGELRVTDRTLTIVAGGAESTMIDGDDSVRALEVNSGANVTLSGVSLVHGGGVSVLDKSPRARAADGTGGAAAVNAGGTLTLLDSEVRDSQAGQYGGGIANAGTLTLVRSTIADNHVTGGESGGGGLYNTNVATLADSTIAQNAVPGGVGGGILTAGSQLTSLSSTIAANTAAAGSAVFRQGDQAAIRARNTIVTGSCGGAVGPTDSAHDLAGDASCRQSATDIVADPKLDQLGTYHGETRTFGLLEGSPAIDQGDNAACADPLIGGIDQTGQPRVSNGVCDIGAFETIHSGSTLDPPAITFPVDGGAVNTRAVTVRGTAPPGTGVHVYYADTEPVDGPVDDDGHWSVVLSLPADGDYEIAAQTYVGTDTSEFSDPVAFTIDTAQPPAPQIGGASAGGSTVTLSGTAESLAVITVLDSGTPVRTTTADGNGAWSVTLTGVAPGTHHYTVVARDRAGNVSPDAARDVTVATQQPATPTPTPAPTPAPEIPPPVVGQQVNAETKSGTVKIKRPGSNTFVTLGPGDQVPVGTTIDTTHGRITLTTAVGGGQTQHADFYQGIFKVSQSTGAHPLTTLTLNGPKPTCAKAKRAHASAKKKVKTRRLWGSGSGAFRTSGQYSSATVRGTTWLTQDSCAGTLVKVTSGAVTVRDFAKRKNVLVRAGKSYLARPRKR